MEACVIVACDPDPLEQIWMELYLTTQHPTKGRTWRIAIDYDGQTPVCETPDVYWPRFGWNELPKRHQLWCTTPDDAPRKHVFESFRVLDHPEWRARTGDFVGEIKVAVFDKDHELTGVEFSIGNATWSVVPGHDRSQVLPAKMSDALLVPAGCRWHLEPVSA